MAVASPRTAFPTLADAPRTQWPATLRVHPAPPRIEGSEETIQCACARTVPAREMIDLRELSAAQLAALGLSRTIECRACFHEHVRHGRALHSAVARALGLHERTAAALEAGEREGLHRGWSVRTKANAHLLAGERPVDTPFSGGADAGAPATVSPTLPGADHA